MEGMSTPSPDPLALIESLTEADVQRSLDDLARREKSLRSLLRAIRRRNRDDIRARRLPPAGEAPHA